MIINRPIPKEYVQMLFDLFTTGLQVNENLTVKAEAVHIDIVKIGESIEIQFTPPKLHLSGTLRNFIKDIVIDRDLDKIIVGTDKVTLDIPNMIDPELPVQ